MCVPTENQLLSQSAADWQRLISRTALVDTSCPHQLIAIERSRLQYQRLEERLPTRMLSHRALVMILFLAIGSLLYVETHASLSLTTLHLAIVGIVLMVSAVLAHLSR